MRSAASRRAARALGVIRLVNGALGLVAPEALVKTFGTSAKDNGAAIYALRLFGVRTVILGMELLFSDEASLDDALVHAVPIHVSDTAAAILAGIYGQLPRRAAITGAAVSSINTALAVIARSGRFAGTPIDPQTV